MMMMMIIIIIDYDNMKRATCDRLRTAMVMKRSTVRHTEDQDGRNPSLPRRVPAPLHARSFSPVTRGGGGRGCLGVTSSRGPRKLSLPGPAQALHRGSVPVLWVGPGMPTCFGSSMPAPTGSQTENDYAVRRSLRLRRPTD